MPAPQDGYLPIRVTTLRGDLKIPFDVYVRIAGKYIHYCRAGESFEGLRLKRLRAKKLKTMYIREDDGPAYRKYLASSIDRAYDASNGQSIEVRAEVVQGFQQALAEEFMENPLDEVCYAHVRSSAERFCEFLEHEPMATAAVLNIDNLDQSVSHHGVTVATLAVAMALKTNLRNENGNPLHLLALGSMIHDVEHYLTEFDFHRPLIELSVIDTMLYRDHPLKGGHRLQGAKFIDQLVLKIITQHEEHGDGTGYPKGLREADLDPLVLIAGTANAYDRLVCFEGLKGREALKTLLIDKVGVFPLEHLRTLQEILKQHGVLTTNKK